MKRRSYQRRTPTATCRPSRGPQPSLSAPDPAPSSALLLLLGRPDRRRAQAVLPVLEPLPHPLEGLLAVRALRLRLVPRLRCLVELELVRPDDPEVRLRAREAELERLL